MNARIVGSSECPERRSLQQLRLWLAQASPGHVGPYESEDIEDFRMLAPRQGPIENLVKTILPVAHVGSFILVSDAYLSYEHKHVLT